MLGGCFPVGTTVLEQIPSAEPLRWHPSSAAFSLGCLVLSSSQACEISLSTWFTSLRPTLKIYLISHPRCSFQFAVCPKGPAYPLAFPFSWSHLSVPPWDLMEAESVTTRPTTQGISPSLYALFYLYLCQTWHITDAHLVIITSHNLGHLPRDNKGGQGQFKCPPPFNFILPSFCNRLDQNQQPCRSTFLCLKNQAPESFWFLGREVKA